jgi:SAM-dependent methyltransferase
LAATNFGYYPVSDDFYRAFEERYRGSRELIKSRQRVYLPFVEPLLSFYEGAKAIDLGCGRGEWLELLKEAGFDAHGVDLDDGMLEACRELGLNVATKDVISALKELPDESQIIVSGFHIAEHIHFSDLQLLVQDALRVLKPGGLLILETPNPENITVGTVNFYLDPTHQRPIPPQLLYFLPEYYGFFRVKLMRLQEDKELAVRDRISLHDILGGVSPDYAVMAQKSAEGSLLACNSDAFAKEYGLTLDTLVEKFDQQAVQARENAASAEAQAKQASEHAASAEAQAKQASERAVNAASALTAVHNSSSWRLTAPLRKISRIKSFNLFKRFKLKIVATLALIKSHFRLYVNRRPRLKLLAVAVLKKIPYAKYGFSLRSKRIDSSDFEKLTPRTKKIYAALKAAIDNNE